MISDETRRRLREHALAQGLGGNRYGNRRHYDNDEIGVLYDRYQNNEDKLSSLFTDKRFKTEASWRNDIARNMDRDSSARLLILVKPRTCRYCDTVIDQHTYVLDAVKISQFCRTCKDGKVWKKATPVNAESRRLRGQRITESKLKFYQGPDGERVRRMIGEKNRVRMLAYMQTEEGLAQKDRVGAKQSMIMKEKIRKGEFTPRITNSWTHWTAQITVDGQLHKFRSSWEACFWLCNQHLQYETIRIPYELAGKPHTYIPDFYDADTNTIYEIKPRSSYNIQIDKMMIVINHCISVGLRFVWINEDNIFDWIDETKFDEINQPQLEKVNRIRYGKISHPKDNKIR